MASTDRVGSDVQTQEKIKALEAALHSETLARAGRLRDLLRFLCEAEIEGRESDLNEYTIGSVALGKGKDFAPLEDSSVRSRTYELRQKLEKYYTQEAPQEPLRIVIRKGSYVPHFIPAPDANAKLHVQVENVSHESRFTSGATSPAVFMDSAQAPQPPPVHNPASSRKLTWALLLAFSTGSAVAASAPFAWTTIRKLFGTAGSRPPITASQWTPELEAIWRPFTESSTPAIIVVENRFFLRMGPLAVRDFSVNALGHVEESEPLMRVKRLFNVQQLYESPNYTDAGTPRAVFNLTRLLSSRIQDFALKSSAETTADDFRNSNIILLAKPWIDPQVGRALSSASLVDADGKILNLHPRPGELFEYKDLADPKDPSRWSEKYSVISLLPGVADDRWVLCLTASGSEHPAALAYYLTDPGTARELYSRLKLDPSRSPRPFQVLVKAEFKSSSVVRVTYVTSRPIP